MMPESLCNSRSAELNSEYRNQVDQLNTLYVENQKLKGEEETKKPKKKETPATLPDEF
jgi:hypothetical protein